jgi:hypothetical protein
MNHKNDIRPAQIILDLTPLLFIQSRPEIVRRDTQAQLVLTINLPLRLPERRE